MSKRIAILARVIWLTACGVAAIFSDSPACCPVWRHRYNAAGCCDKPNLANIPALSCLKRNGTIGILTHALNTTAAHFYWTKWNEGMNRASQLTYTTTDVATQLVEGGYDAELHAATLNGWCRKGSEIVGIVFTMPFTHGTDGFDIVHRAVQSCQDNGIRMVLSNTDAYFQYNHKLTSLVGVNNYEVGKKCAQWISYTNHVDGALINTTETLIMEYGDRQEVDDNTAVRRRYRSINETVKTLLNDTVIVNTNLTKFINEYMLKKNKYMDVRVVGMSTTSIINLLGVNNVEWSNNTVVLNCGDGALPAATHYWIGQDPISEGYDSFMRVLFSLQTTEVTQRRHWDTQQDDWNEDHTVSWQSGLSWPNGETIEPTQRKFGGGLGGARHGGSEWYGDSWGQGAASG